MGKNEKKKNKPKTQDQTLPTLAEEVVQELPGSHGFGSAEVGASLSYIKDVSHSSMNIHHKLSRGLCWFVLKYPEPALETPGIGDYISREIFLL